MAMTVKLTGIGSLPHSNIEDAIEYSLKHDLPFFPQILSIHGNMISQLKNLKFDHIKLFTERAKLAGHKTIKVQLAGPNTSNLSISHYETAFDKITSVIKDLNIVIFIDEPILNHNKELNKLVALAKNTFYKIGVHCCNKLDEENISLLNELNLDIISYDAILNPGLENQFSCKEIALGCISTEDTTEILSKNSKVSYLSATCGLALSQRDPDEVLNQLIKLRDNL